MGKWCWQPGASKAVCAGTILRVKPRGLADVLLRWERNRCTMDDCRFGLNNQREGLHEQRWKQQALRRGKKEELVQDLCGPLCRAARKPERGKGRVEGSQGSMSEPLQALLLTEPQARAATQGPTSQVGRQGTDFHSEPFTPRSLKGRDEPRQGGRKPPPTTPDEDHHPGSPQDPKRGWRTLGCPKLRP